MPVTGSTAWCNVIDRGDDPAYSIVELDAFSNVCTHPNSSKAGHAVTHDSSVIYADTFVEVADPSKWTIRSRNDYVEISGECPACQGPAYGPTLPPAPNYSGGVGVLPLNCDEAVPFSDIIVRCACGFPHGEPGKASCGRKAVIRIKEM